MFNSESKKFSNPVVPQIMHKNKIGNLTGATYLNSCHECYASSSKGWLLIFGNTLYPKPFEEGELDNSKIFRNAVRVSPVSIGCCTTTDGRVRILYWLKNYNLASITSISFHLVPKFKHQDAHVFYTPKSYEDRICECEYKDMVEEIEALFREDLPTDATLKRNPFFVNDFFVATTDSNTYAIDFINDKCVPLFLIADDYVSAIEIHDEFPYIIVGYANSRLLMINYNKNELVNNTVLPVTTESTEDLSISCIKYSAESRHLVCGKENGEIWVLEPILLAPKTNGLFRPTKNKVVKIKFSTNTTQFAYYDTARTVVLFTYDVESSEWIFRGKIRSHYDDINDIMFMPSDKSSTLYTISNDRHMVEYNNEIIDDEEEFGILTRERIEQTASPMNFLYWFESSEATNRKFENTTFSFIHKIKFLYHTTKIPRIVVLAPAFGCFKNQLIRKMKVVDFVLSPDGKYIFTFGVDDHCVFKWEIKPKAVELMHLLGGKELEPFYCLIEGGKNGWLFQEIKDLFYYMQILQQENIDLPRRVSDNISLSELPDLLENMMIDIKYRNYNESGKINEEVNFIDFVKLFCNHKPAYGYSKERVEKAFTILEEHAGHSSGDGINRGGIYEIFNNYRVGGTEETDFLPEEINFETLYEQILGIDMNRTQIMEGIHDDIPKDEDESD
ncbi:hypothetical protein NQ314_014073 [Rhamnusium bicolor]|uniref:Uncharacterized protein n=1 Tax=Rhamnusium bicolor TaxID=1586634 RepID=A0AAV8X4L4_9CUCU|nr:hypothetical protein NQ314_014073 [Rhamnusium bicolor]